MKMHSQIGYKPSFSQWGYFSLMVSFLLLFAGCNQIMNQLNKTQTLTSPTGLSAPVSLPAEMTATKELLDTSVLATLPRSNPFESLLVPSGSQVDPSLLQNPGGAPATLEPVNIPDPYEGFSLGGIIYHGQKSLGIVVAADGKSRIVRQGDILSASGDTGIQLLVARIDQKALTLQALNPPKELSTALHSKMLTITSLVGHQSNKTASSSSKAPAAETASNISGSEINALLNGLSAGIPGSNSAPVLPGGPPTIQNVNR